MGIASVGSLAEQAPRSVHFPGASAPLILHPGYTEISRAFRDSLRTESVVALYDEKLNFTTFVGLACQSKLQAYMADKYAGFAIDGILTVGTSLRYGIQMRSGGWPDVPVVFAAVDPEAADAIVKLRGTTGTNSGSEIRTENIKKKIFKPFFTTKRNVMGLGLLISKSMFHAQGGKLNLPQIKNAAAEFHLVLPSNNGGAV